MLRRTTWTFKQHWTRLIALPRTRRVGLHVKTKWTVKKKTKTKVTKDKEHRQYYANKIKDNCYIVFTNRQGEQETCWNKHAGLQLAEVGEDTLQGGKVVYWSKLLNQLVEFGVLEFIPGALDAQKGTNNGTYRVCGACFEQAGATGLMKSLLNRGLLCLYSSFSPALI